MLRSSMELLFTCSRILCCRRMGLGSPAAPIWTLPWTWRLDSRCPLGTLSSTVSPPELRKKTAPSPAMWTSGRKTSWWKNPRILISPSPTSPSQKRLTYEGNSTIFRPKIIQNQMFEILRAEQILGDHQVQWPSFSFLFFICFWGEMGKVLDY